MSANEKLSIGVIFGGRSGEHEVSLASARSVIAALDPAKYDIVQIGINRSGAWVTGEDVLGRLTQEGTAGLSSSLTACTLLPDPTRGGLYAIRGDEQAQNLEPLTQLDVIFPVLHGTFGEDGTLQGLLELAGAAYVGAGVVGSAVCMDKDIFKRIMQAHGIPVLEWALVSRREVQADLAGLVARLIGLAPFPIFVKPANLGSSVGITKCRSRSDLAEGLLEAARFDRRILVERGINGREIEVSVLGNTEPQTSIPGEIRPAADFYSYEAKYQDERSELLIPAPLSPELASRIQTLAVQAYQAADCAGMARVDFLLDQDSGALYLNEINTIPGFTQISMYPKLWAASGLPYPQLLDRLIDLALERQADRAQTVYRQ